MRHGYHQVSSDDTAEQAVEAPEKVNTFSLLTFHWMNSVFKTGSERPLEQCDFLPLSEEDTTDFVTNNLQNKWTEEVKGCKPGKRPKLWKCVLKIFSLKDILVLVFSWLLNTVCRFVQPFLLGFLISRLVSSEDPKHEVSLYVCAAAMTANGFITSLSMHQFDFQNELMGVRMCSAVKGIVYLKIQMVSKQTLMEFTTGQVIDLVSNDVERLEELSKRFFCVFADLFEMVGVTCLMYFLFGWQALMGIAFLVFLVPCHAAISVHIASLRLRTAAVSDKRISLMNEIVTGIRAIKAHAWEDRCQEKIHEARRAEIRIIRMKNALLSGLLGLGHATGSVTTFVSVLTLSLTYEPVTPVNTFMLLSFLNIIRMCSSQRTSHGLQMLFEGLASFKRIEVFLCLDNLPSLMVFNSEFNAPSVHDEVQNVTPANKEEPAHCEPVALEVSSLAYTETKLGGKSLLENIHFALPSKTLTVLTGPVGSGKSTLLSVIVGEISPTNGTIQRRGTVLLVPQTAWVFSGTIRDNILFGERYNEKRYNDVVEACALQEDFQQFPQYDHTIVGERGVLLSGGQRARVSLARAVYTDADIFLLDDPLSAVDFKVSKHIFQRCFVQLLRDKTRLLVSHRENHMEAADQVILLYKGSVLGKGSFAELKESNLLNTAIDPLLEETQDLGKPIKESQGLSPAVESQVSSCFETSPDSCRSKGLERVQEDRAIGRISFRLYWDYFRSGLHTGAILGLFSLYLMTQAIMVSSDVWLSYLTTKPLQEQRSKTNLAIYGGLVGASMVFGIIRAYLLLIASLRCSERLHDKMVAAVLQAPVLFFDLNPVGRILNRFSKDIGCLDEVLPKAFLIALQYTFYVFAATLVPVAVNPWLLLLVVLLFVICVYIVKYYLKTSRELKRLESICRSPVFSHISETLNGLDTIRTRGKQQDFIDQLYRYQNIHNRSFIMVVASGRWLGVRLDLLAGVLTGAVALAAILLSENAALVGLSLVYALGTIDRTQFAVRLLTNVENFMTSVERVMTYTKLEPESGYKDYTIPPKPWPLKGNISFRNVSLKYYPGGPKVLKNLDFDINGKSKIGVVGRTGAGKSSLVAAMLRMPDPDGDVIIDGVKLKEINLQESRRCISVLGQSPFLFSGSLRRNLDPMGQHQDVDLWGALEDVQLKQLVKGLEGQLEYELLEHGSNLSVGERQLMCLARVLLTRNKIIILDEPTAHVDPDTEQTIWNIVRAKLSDSTVITIAHRLQTVRDCDMILTFSAGELVDYDKFDTLLSKERSILADMAHS